MLAQLHVEGPRVAAPRHDQRDRIPESFDPLYSAVLRSSRVFAVCGATHDMDGASLEPMPRDQPAAPDTTRSAGDHDRKAACAPSPWTGVLQLLLLGGVGAADVLGHVRNGHREVDVLRTLSLERFAHSLLVVLDQLAFERSV